MTTSPDPAHAGRRRYWGGMGSSEDFQPCAGVVPVAVADGSGRDDTILVPPLQPPKTWSGARDMQIVQGETSISVPRTHISLRY